MQPRRSRSWIVHQVFVLRTPCFGLGVAIGALATLAARR
jgi:hypothetical protein